MPAIIALLSLVLIFLFVQLAFKEGFTMGSESERERDTQQTSKADDNVLPAASLRLQVARAMRDSHHRALWEEEKHFTWLLSIVLTADAVLLFRSAGLPEPDRSLAIGVASTLGALV
jgi:hypothetical protein